MHRFLLALFLLALIAAPAALAQDRDTGSLDISARLQPTSARAEPVMRLPLHLLSKSYAEILAEAETEVEPPDLEKFVDGLSVSDEMKEWMKRTKMVRLTDRRLVAHLAVDDVFNIPEFFEAYIARNAGDVTTGFPAAKHRERERNENPARYERQVREYREALRRHLTANPHTMVGIELELTALDPGSRWAALERERGYRVRMRTMELAQRRYHVARTETDLEGRCGFTGLAPGNYWLSTLEGEGRVGDIRLRWDVPVAVSAGRVTSIELHNLNGTPPPQAGARR